MELLGGAGGGQGSEVEATKQPATGLQGMLRDMGKLWGAEQYEKEFDLDAYGRGQ